MENIEKKYCAFIDVLGYGNIMLDPNRSTEKKKQILFSIYNNLLGSFISTIKTININGEKVFISSFSDSIYLESEDPGLLLYSCYQIFNITFNYYLNFSQENAYTPLLRCGIVKDWTMRFINIDDLVKTKNNTYEETMQNPTNLVGLGVVRAYQVSEKSNLSGMRIIISPEVLNDLNPIDKLAIPFECLAYNCQYYIDLKNDKNEQTFPMFFIPIRKNEKDENVNLYELIWPVYIPIVDLQNQLTIYSCINELRKMKGNFPQKQKRHFVKTAYIIHKAYLLSRDNSGTNDDKKVLTILEDFIKEDL